MSFAYPLSGLVTLVSILIYMWMGFSVGGARARHKVPAPAMTGPEDFMRVYRVHYNTLEQMAAFLPSLWLFALTTQDAWAAAVGLFFPIGRILYALGYYKAADKRSTGFTISLLSIVVLIFGSLIAIIMQLAGL
ncbi:MAG: MAPEG family protein [Parvibaculum sp.]